MTPGQKQAWMAGEVKAYEKEKAMFGKTGTRELQKQHDQLMARSRDAEAKGFGGTARKAAEAAEQIARQIEAQEPQTWQAGHP
jgi:hypothetical protein